MMRDNDEDPDIYTSRRAIGSLWQARTPPEATRPESAADEGKVRKHRWPRIADMPVTKRVPMPDDPA